MANEVATTPEQVMLAFLSSDETFQGFGFGSQAISEGFEGVVESIGFQEVSGTGITKRTEPQSVNTKAGSVQIAAAGDYSKSPAIVFEGGARSLTISALTQHPESSIVIDGAEPVPFIKVTGKQWAALVAGKYKLYCDKAENDPARLIPRIARFTQKTEMRPMRKYEFTATKGL